MSAVTVINHSTGKSFIVSDDDCSNIILALGEAWSASRRRNHHATAEDYWSTKDRITEALMPEWMRGETR